MSLKLPKKKESTSGITALIDMDVIRYQVGFACQKKQEDGTIVADPIEHCLHSVKVFLHSVMEATDAQFHKGYLTGKGNFREELATILPYKGNRKQEKPIHYQAITEYLINVWGAEVIEGMEADDKLAIEQTKGGGKTIVCSIDKDLLQCEGKHFQWNKPDKGVFEITEFEGLYNFYTQLACGDPVDNIQGIPGIGKVKAAKILEGLETELEMYVAVFEAYFEALDKEHSLMNTTHENERKLIETTERAVLENAHLLFMIRELNEDDSLVHWEPPS